MDGAVGISQPRRQLKMRSGPMKALPLSMVVTNAAHLEANAGECVLGASSKRPKMVYVTSWGKEVFYYNYSWLFVCAGSENSGGSSSSIKGPLSQRKRITVPSFGSISSIGEWDWRCLVLYLLVQILMKKKSTGLICLHHQGCVCSGGTFVYICDYPWCHITIMSS